MIDRTSETQLRDMYLDLLKKCLTDDIYGDTRMGLELYERVGESPKNIARSMLIRWLRSRGLRLVRPYTADERAKGSAYPAVAHTMVGVARLDHLQSCIEQLLREEVRGDLIETGVWRGGAAIFMRGVLRAYRANSRLVWAADSFRGLPKPDPDRYPEDRGDKYYTDDFLRVSLEQVRANFERYGLLDDGVRFLEGWFKDTLPTAPITRIALLRFDGDMYESTWEVLTSLYSRIEPGGFVIVDDYFVVPACRKAVHDFLESIHSPTEPQRIPRSNDGVFWRRDP